MPDYKVPGPCSIHFITDLGKTKAGVILRCRLPWAPIVTEENADEPADFRFAGKSCQVEAQLVDMAKLKASTIMSYLTVAKDQVPGQLASESITPLTITDRTGKIWKAKNAVLTAPGDVLLAVTSEIIVPVIWNIVPQITADGVVLFEQIPDYVL